MMALLFQREVFIQRAEPGTSANESFDTWMGVFTPSSDGSETQIGYVHSTSRRNDRNGVIGSEYSLEFELTTMLLSVPTELFLEGTAWVPDVTGLSNFTFSLSSSGSHAMSVTGIVNDGILALEIETGGDTFPMELPVGRDLLLSGNLGTSTLNLPALEVGDEVIMDAFDPVTFSSGVARVKCVGTEVLDDGGNPVFTKILTTTLGGITTKTWVASNEEVIRVETPFGLILRKIPPENAELARAAPVPAELLDNIAIRPAGHTPFRGARRMEVRLSGFPNGALPPSDDLQKKIGPGHYLIQTAGLVSHEAPGFVPGIHENPDDEVHAEFLQGDAFVQVNHPRIARQARDIVGDDTLPWDRARKIYAWLYENIEKTIVLSLPSALDVLNTRQGDCNEHTVLFAALARSIDIPTRIAIGLVWSDDLAGFYYHAWPEVYVGKWVPMDPTLGQEIADATHIKLLNGDIDAWPQLIAYLGQLEVDVLEIQ